MIYLTLEYGTVSVSLRLEDDEDESSDGAAGKTIFDSGTLFEGSSILHLIDLSNLYSVSVSGLSVCIGEFSQSIPGMICRRPNTHSIFFLQLHAELRAILHLHIYCTIRPASVLQVVMDNSWAEAEEAER